jgi:tricorn protease
VTSTDYLRFPHINGDLLTFVAQDDVWLGPPQGGRAWRLSADGAVAAWPRLSADASQVAWAGTSDGAAEVYVCDIDGSGASRRLTYWGDPRTRVSGWSPDGEVLAVSSAGQPFGFWQRGHAVSADPAAPGSRELPFGVLSDVAIDAGAAAVLTGTPGDPASRKRYRGGTAGRLWLRRAGQGGTHGPFRRVLADVPGHFASPMLVGGRMAFLSDHEGSGNIYSVDLEGGDLRRHTDHDGPYARQAATDGQRIVYSCRGELWLLDGLDADGPRLLEISLAAATAGRAPRLISAADHVGDLSCDETGQASAVEVRGTIHWLTHRDGPGRALLVTPGVRARLPRVLGRDGLVVWVTDAGGQHALEIGGERDGQVVPPRTLAAGEIGIVSDLSAAPDGATLAVTSRDGQLRLVDVASGAVHDLVRSDDGEISGLTWSPDSAWLAWSQPGPQPLRRIRISRVADRAVHDVTDGRFVDSDPVFTSDGTYLAFLSKRSFDPIYDAHFFDLSFPLGSRPYLVPLAATTPSPFAPQPGGRRIGEGPKRGGHEDAGGKGGGAGTGTGDTTVTEASQEATSGGGADTPQPPAVIIDFEGIAARIVAVPVSESRYASLQAVKGGLAWLREPVSGNLGQGGARPTDDAPRPALERFDLQRHKVSQLTDDVDWFVTSGDGSRLVVSDHGKLTVLPADRKADSDNPDDQVSVDGSRARFLADPVRLWRHALDEAGRLMANDFWVADMADVDWAAVLAEYRPLVDQVASPGDFADLLWEVFGELGCSHAYVTEASNGSGGGGTGGGTGAGLLGADLERDADGGWRIGRVIPGESSDPLARSPLSGPGASLTRGERLLAVDGQPVGPAGPGPLLVGTAGKPVELRVSGDDGSQRRVVVTPLRSESRLRYQDWVAGRRAEVRERSEGRLGYLHVPDMVSGGWADFHRDLRTEMRKDGLILDVRGNRGGHTSQLIVEKLARRIIGWDVARFIQPLSYPEDATRGPMVALSDEYAGSDGDIVTAAIKLLDLAPVVGARTWGGVIGIDSGAVLVDGTAMTIPKYSFWFDRLGWGVENYGVDPDVEVLISPDDWAAGRDTQLEAAVDMAMAALREHPPAGPPDLSARPSRLRPPLPPRPDGASAAH